MDGLPRASVCSRASAMRAGLAALLAGALLAVSGVAGSAAPRRASSRTDFGCPILPAEDPLNQEIANAPVSPNSASYIASIGASVHLHPDFGTPPSYGIPYVVVGPQQPKMPIKFGAYRAESDPGPYPVPANAPIEGGGRRGHGDKHVLVVQEGACMLYEMFHARKTRTGWRADSGAVFNLRSSALRREGWTSADAAGLPIFPLLARYPEAHSGRIEHALRVTVPQSQRGYIHPATHFASSSTDPNLPPMGLRLRLKASYSLEGFSGESLVIPEALKRYGLIVADNGSPWFITGAPSAAWSDVSLEALKRVPGSEFEAVESGPIIHG